MEEKSLAFLHHVCEGVNHTSLNYWISNDEFAERIRYMMSCGLTIDKQTVFETMRSLYLDYEATRGATGKDVKFDFRLARWAITSLWKSLTGTKEGWRGE